MPAVSCVGKEGRRLRLKSAIHLRLLCLYRPTGTRRLVQAFECASSGFVKRTFSSRCGVPSLSRRLLPWLFLTAALAFPWRVGATLAAKGLLAPLCLGSPTVHFQEPDFSNIRRRCAADDASDLPLRGYRRRLRQGVSKETIHIIDVRGLSGRIVVDCSAGKIRRASWKQEAVRVEFVDESPFRRRLVNCSVSSRETTSKNGGMTVFLTVVPRRPDSKGRRASSRNPGIGDSNCKAETQSANHMERSERRKTDYKLRASGYRQNAAEDRSHTGDLRWP